MPERLVPCSRQGEQADGAAAVVLTADNGVLRRVVRRVALFNLGYFGIEFAVALAIGSVPLFADSVG